MARGYDGSINIDTKIDSGGMNKGVRAIGTRFQGLGKTITGMWQKATLGMLMFGLGLSVVVTAISVAIQALARMAVDMWRVIKDSGAFKAEVDQLTASFNGLKGALASAFLPLFQVALPAIITVINWLTRLLQIVAMVVAALRGQSTYMVATATAANAAAGGAGKLAKETKKAEKAARGALAAFDDINVLQQKQDEPEAPEIPTGGGAGGGISPFTWEEAPIEEGILSWVAKFREAVDNIKAKWQELKDTAAVIVNAILDWFKTAWENIKIWAGIAWDWIKTKWIEAGPWFQGIIDEVKARFVNLWEAIKADAARAWLAVQLAWGAARIWFQTQVIDPVRNGFDEALRKIKNFFSTAWLGIQLVWVLAKQWFQTKVTDPIKNAFKTALEWIDEKFTTVFNGIKTTVRGVVNVVITILNKLLNGMAQAVNGMIDIINGMQVNVPNWVPVIGGQSYSFAIPRVPTPQIPYLATGGVIPAHSNMLAMIGEGSQREIVSPEDLMRRIVREEMGGGGDMVIEMPVYLDGEVIYKNQKRVERRRGTSLVMGGA